MNGVGFFAACFADRGVCEVQIRVLACAGFAQINCMVCNNVIFSGSLRFVEALGEDVFNRLVLAHDHGKS